MSLSPLLFLCVLIPWPPDILTRQINADCIKAVHAVVVLPEADKTYRNTGLIGSIVIWLSQKPVPVVHLSILIVALVWQWPLPSVHIFVEPNPGKLQEIYSDFMSKSKTFNVNIFVCFILLYILHLSLN